MKEIDKYAGKNILVLGLGRSGFAVSKLLLKLGARLTLNDKADLAADPKAKQLADLGVRVIGGSHPVDLFDQEKFDYLVKNPGIPYENPMVAKASEKGVPIITEPEVALSASESPYVCVTGSNGKTTTVMLTQQIMDHYLQKQGHHAYAVGNIGWPISEVVLNQAGPDDLLVVEMSSFQLMGVTDIEPKVAAIVDIYNNVHLDYHKTFDNYVDAKLNVCRFQKASDYFLANFDQKDILAREEKATKAKILTFSENDPVADFYIGQDYLMHGEEKMMKIADIKLPGIHNLQNSLVAIGISSLMGAGKDDIAAVLSTFTGAEHRLQYVTTLDGVKVYNDSKSTNIEAATVAIQSFKQPEVLLAGGLDRGFVFDSLVDLFKKHVKAIVTYGETRYLLADAARKAGIKTIVVVDNLHEGVKAASKLAEAGDVLLFSPACASWDQFKTFEERGEYFVKYVKELEEK